jgi:DNA-binding PucR family transcriptional regulator
VTRVSDGTITCGAAELVATIARELEPRLSAITGEMVNQFSDLIPALRTDDEDVRELMAASTHANVATVLDMMAHDIPLEEVEVPAAAGHFARRLAQREVPVEALLRAYRLGESMFVQWWLRLVERHQPNPEVLLVATRRLTALTSGYIDKISDLLVQIYSEERAGWVRRVAATRAAQVRAVLVAEDLELNTAEALTGHRMQGVHLAMVAWTVPGERRRSAESAIGAIGRAAGLVPLAVLADEHTLWAWVTAPSVEPRLDGCVLRQELSAEGGGVRVAVGAPASGLAGFRASHADALSAQRVASLHGDGAPEVVEYTEVAQSAFLARDPRAARRWVADVLGRLAAGDEAMAELRHTMLCYLRAGSSLTEAASELHLHKNTVRYRLRKAEDILGRPIGQRRLDTEVALRACDQLGGAVLG